MQSVHNGNKCVTILALNVPWCQPQLSLPALIQRDVESESEGERSPTIVGVKEKERKDV